MGKAHSKSTVCVNNNNNSGIINSRTHKRKRSPVNFPFIPHNDVCEIFDCCDRNCFSNYVFPCDNDEIDRLTVQHYVFQNIWKNNFSAPIESKLKEGCKVLDVGCGPGVWILEMANHYPNSTFMGVDIVSTYPEHIRPNNTKFCQANVIDRLPFEDNTFDFVYMRFMMFAFTSEDWKKAIKELIRVCKPSGFLEIMERDILWYNEGNLVKKWRTAVVDRFKKEKDIDLIITPHILGYLKETRQLTKISFDAREAPLGSFGGKLGEAYAKIIKWGATNLGDAVSSIDFEGGNYDSLIDICMDELERNKSYDKSYRFWATKNL